jgi:hypothetical protein
MLKYPHRLIEMPDKIVVVAGLKCMEILKKPRGLLIFIKCAMQKFGKIS